MQEMTPEESARRRAEFAQRCEIRRAEVTRQRRLDAERGVRRPMMRLVTDAQPRLLRAPAFWLNDLKPSEAEATWECNICGPVKATQFLQGWRPGRCECQRLEFECKRLEKEQAERDAKDLEERRKASTPQRCYYWLGEDFSEEGMEDFTFGNFQAYTQDLKELLANVKLQAINPASVLVFAGSPGTGKTHLACALFNYWRTKQVQPGLFTTSPNLHSYIARRRELNEPYHDIEQKLAKAPILVLDDIDKVSMTEARGTLYFNLFNKRMNFEMKHPGSRITIVTTNVDLADPSGLAAWIGEAAASRLNFLRLADYDVRIVIED